ncbi:MAG: hypothetical protein EBZ21_08100 [Flavobacteriia bacterium]|nr:hypothetical protein [Flavobacteriia bacterium]NDA28734.1 hypothetical protein [Flavobacteriia bacterium]NDD80872.1 hypothetical protein [Flavobacteriia bacterium]
MDTTIDSPDFDPVLDGQVDELGGAEESESILDVDTYGNHYVTVKVDGEEVRVPLSEAVAGYSRQADYTRKTQELAQQRQELQWASAIKAALENDPAGTIDLLADHYGVSRKEAQKMVDEDPFFSDFSMDDPVAKRLSDIDERVSAFERMQAQQRLESEISRLKSTYGDDFDPQEVVAAAVAQGSTNLEAVFKQIAFDRLAARQKVSSEKAAKQTEAKRQASVVSGAASVKTAKDDVGTIRSIADAWAAAKRQHGVS